MSRDSWTATVVVMRQLGRVGWLAAVITAVVGLPTPAAAAGEVTVPSTTLTVSAVGSRTVVQKITTSQRVYSTKITMENGAASRVLQVLNKPSDVEVAVVCSGGSGAWSCGGLEPTGYIQITYSQTYGMAPLDLGTFAVAVSMGVNGQTFSGAGAVTVTTSAELEIMTPRLELLAGAGYATFRVRNNGVVPSPVTLTINGLGTVPVDDQGNGCSRSGSSLICQGTIPVDSTFGPQLKMTGTAWRSLRLTAKVSGPYPDPKTGNNAVAIGPYGAAPAVIPTESSSGRPGPVKQPTVTGSASAVAAPVPSAEASADPTISAAPAAPVSTAGPRAITPILTADAHAGTSTLTIVATIMLALMAAIGVGIALLLRRGRGRGRSTVSL
jgi:hypothetical protein